MSEQSSLPADRRERLAVRARTLAFIYFVALFLGTHLPASLEKSAPVSDKTCHLVGYGILTLCVLVGWELTIGVLKPKHYFAVWLVGTLYGAFDEITQVPVGRDCDVNDWAADVLGIVCGLIAFRLLRRGLYWLLARGEALSMGKS